MANAKRLQEAMNVGRRRAAEILKLRAAASKTRAKALKANPKPLALRIQAVPRKGMPVPRATVMQTAGVLVSEGDSWFDYPLHDVLKELEDNHGYDVESVAHRDDPIEEMAYGDMTPHAVAPAPDVGADAVFDAPQPSLVQKHTN